MFDMIFIYIYTYIHIINIYIYNMISNILYSIIQTSNQDTPYSITVELDEMADGILGSANSSTGEIILNK